MQHLSTGHDHAKRPVTFREIRNYLDTTGKTTYEDVFRPLLIPFGANIPPAGSCKGAVPRADPGTDHDYWSRRLRNTLAFVGGDQTDETIRVIRTLTRGLLVALVVVSGAASAYTLSFSPSAQDVGLGSFATVEVRITDVAPEPPGSPGGLGDYDFEVVYDPAIITFDKATDAVPGFGHRPGR
ncbi:MAG: hypothetical protein IPG20_22440 [Gammaproteobacteria bacterium]|nr:hypothetical protein [Gammaproteobacteria bacterium]